MFLVSSVLKICLKKLWKKLVQTISELPKGVKSKNKYSRIVANDSMHTALNLTLCSLLIPWSIFVSLGKRSFLFSSPPNSFLITTFSELFLATKTKPWDPQPIASSLSCNCSRANNGKPWQSRDPSELYFPFRKGNLNALELTICFGHLVEKKFFKFLLMATFC